MAIVRLFASAREAAGTGRCELAGSTVTEVLDEACRVFGDHFAEVLDGSNVWLNGDTADLGSAVSDQDEIAVLPPVSGG
ncbi:MAG: MoaD/ThiS family protein [Acidimicrobiales bacterium]